MGEGVALARAVEASGCVYFFAENYCYMAVVQEMRRLYLEGLLGTPRHLEGEYVHPIPPEGYDQLSPGLNHWRNWIPYTYYCTHALGPLMYMSDAEPVEVSARSIPYTPEARAQLHVKRSDWSSVMLCAMDTGAVATVNGGPSALPGHGTWYRLYGERGLAENLREYGKHHKLRLVFNDWEVPSGYTSEQIYAPDFPELGEEAARAGHGGGDFFVLHHFAQALRTGSAPWLDVYRGLAMTTVGIQAWRSALAGGRPYPIPNWRDEAERAPYADDHWSPFPEDAGPGQPPPSLDGFVEPTPEQIAAARAVWEEMDRQ
jgi:predicted dehydrogenase